MTKDIIITGLPRSGTTLVCHLLNKVPDTVALSEPLKGSELASLSDHQAICAKIERFFAHSRRSLRQDGVALSKQVDGHIPDNHFGDSYSRLWRGVIERLQSHLPFMRRLPLGLRANRVSRGRVRVGKPLSPDFLLCIKQPNAFTALLGALVQRFACYAVVRNPLATLASWNSCAMPARDGRAPAAEHLDPALDHALTRCADRFERQICLLSWHFDRYLAHLPAERILRYEDIVASGGASLTALAPRARCLVQPLADKNRNQLYSRRLVRHLGEKLLDGEGTHWHFYARSAVEKLLQDFR